MQPSTSGVCWALLAIASLSLHACIGGDGASVVSTEVSADAPAVALGSSAAVLDYGETDETCFRVPGVARGTGYAQRPELALGVRWRASLGCGVGEEDCTWQATTDAYVGPGIDQVVTPVPVFDGVVRFDDTASTAALSEIFGTTMAPGAMAEVSASRTFAGTIDTREPEVQAAIAAWREAGGEEASGLSWNVTRFEWSATFLVPDDVYDDDVEIVIVDGEPYRVTDNALLGYEVFVCLLPL